MTLAPHRVWGPQGGLPLLALHCSLSHGGEWSALAAEMPAQRLVAWDQPGHGRQPEWDGVSDLHRAATADAAAMAEAFGQGAPVDLMGHSFGATVALRLALERPDLVRRLILIEPVLFAAARGTVAFDGFAEGQGEMQRRLAAGDTGGATAAFLADWGGGLPFDSLPPALRDYMTARIRMIPAQNGVLAEDTAGLLQPGRLEALRGPVLLVEGDRSPPVVAAIQAALAARLPDATRAVVPGAGHMLPVTHAAALAGLVAAHLA
jgi:pimeloyl-ACP methyl ester carboxylesterase